MTTPADTSLAAHSVGQHVGFERTIVGIDGSPESIEAVRQALALLEPDGQLTLVSTWEVAPTIVGGTGMGIPNYYDEDVQRTAAEDAAQRGYEAIRDRCRPHVRVVRGRPSQQLVGETDDDRGALIAVGSHGTGRMRGIVLGSTTTELVHHAPCSVLVARAAGTDFPRKIVVGVDGSPGSETAYATARRLAHHAQAELCPVVAYGGKGVDKHETAKIVDRPYAEPLDEPVRALVAAAADADLVVIGSRGLHGVRALGSVSERVAHEAPCSVLVVRRDAGTD